MTIDNYMRGAIGAHPLPITGRLSDGHPCTIMIWDNSKGIHRQISCNIRKSAKNLVEIFRVFCSTAYLHVFYNTWDFLHKQMQLPYSELKPKLLSINIEWRKVWFFSSWSSELIRKFTSSLIFYFFTFAD